MYTSAKVVKTVVSRTVNLTLDDKEYLTLIEAKKWYEANRNGHNWHVNMAFQILTDIARAIEHEESSTL